MSQGANFRRTLPGFGLAVAIFGTYMAPGWTYARFGPKPLRERSDETFDGVRYGGAFVPKEESHGSHH